MAEHSSIELGGKRNGYELVEQALGLRGPDPEMEFAAALMRSFARQRDVGRQHLAKAAAGAAEGSLLARNLVTHCHLLQIQAGTLAELRSQAVTAKK